MDSDHEGRDDHYVDIDRMTNEGLAGGRVLPGQNGLIEDDTTHTMDQRFEERRPPASARKPDTQDM